MSRISLKTDHEQQQYENMCGVLEKKAAANDHTSAFGAASNKVRAPPDVFINFGTWLNVWTKGSA